MCDLINRQDVIKAVLVSNFSACTVYGRSEEGMETAKELIQAIKNLPSVQPAITDEQAIEYLQTTGWMQNHDREMYDMGLKKQLADDSGSYDSLIPCEDTISRQAAIDVAKQHWYKPDIAKALEDLPSAHPLDPCETCLYKGKGWDEEPCDGCTGTESKYVPDNGWIPVSERLPELNNDGASDPVLLCWADRQIVVGFYAGNETFYAQSFPFATDGTARIIAWMPLPEPMELEED